MLGTMQLQINSGTVPPNFNYLLDCMSMTHTTSSDSCFLASDILILLLTLPSIGISSYKTDRFAQPYSLIG